VTEALRGEAKGRYRASFVGLIHSAADYFIRMDKDTANGSLASLQSSSCLTLVISNCSGQP